MIRPPFRSRAGPCDIREDERELDFSGLLAELQALIGSRVVVEARARDGRVFEESAGTLEHSIDLQVD